MTRRLSALSSFYRFAAAHDLRDGNPVHGVRRPAVDPDHTRTVGLSRDQARALVAAADTDPGPQAARSAALVRLLLHNGLRVDELVCADVTDLGTRPGRSEGPHVNHRVLGIVRKGGRAATVALARPPSRSSRPTSTGAPPRPGSSGPGWPGRCWRPAPGGD